MKKNEKVATYAFIFFSTLSILSNLWQTKKIIGMRNAVYITKDALCFSHSSSPLRAFPFPSYHITNAAPPCRHQDQQNKDATLFSVFVQEKNSCTRPPQST